MQCKEEKKIYSSQDNYIDIHQHLHDGIQLRLFASFSSDKFLEYQKDLIQECIGNLVEGLQKEGDTEYIRSVCEAALQDLNIKLKAFADKVRDVEYFDIKGFLQIIYGNMLVASLIGESTVMIFRDHRMYYNLTNATKQRGKIDVFSEFIEGDIESGDELLYVGTKISDILDNYDIKQMEEVLQTGEALVPFLGELVQGRKDTNDVGFLIGYNLVGAVKQKYSFQNIPMQGWKDKINVLFQWKEKIFKNKYQATVGILSVVIAFMVYSLVSQLSNQGTKEVYTDSQGVTVDLTIEDIKKDIVLFKSMDSAGDEKGMKYQEILNKLTLLEKKGRRTDDIAQLKKILKADYYKGFNIITVSNLNQFDDPLAGKQTTILTFNSAEQGKLGSLMGIEYWKDMMIAGTKGSLIGASDDNSRGMIVEYGTEDAMKTCSMNLLKDGFYCFTANGKIYLITRGGIESVTTGDPDGFPGVIGGIATYGKANMYVFAPNVTDLANSTFAIRYRNTLGSQSVYQAGQKYVISPSLATGLNFGSGFSAFGIDVNFLAWSDGKLYQFWRNPATSLQLTYREIKLLGGDKITNKYADNIKIITPSNSRYLYIFDKDNQTFTVYESRPLKTNDQFATNYNLNYLFRFGFDLGGNKVVDVTIPDATGDRPEVYILHNNGVNKVKLYEFIESIKNNNVLKQVN